MFFSFFSSRFKRRVDYLDFDDYAEKINTLDTFAFQQETREQNLKNTLAQEENELRRRAPFL